MLSKSCAESKSSSTSPTTALQQQQQQQRQTPISYQTSGVVCSAGGRTGRVKAHRHQPVLADACLLMLCAMPHWLGCCCCCCMVGYALDGWLLYCPHIASDCLRSSLHACTWPCTHMLSPRTTYKPRGICSTAACKQRTHARAQQQRNHSEHAVTAAHPFELSMKLGC